MAKQRVPQAEDGANDERMIRGEAPNDETQGPAQHRGGCAG